jgi:hypothetical protein
MSRQLLAAALAHVPANSELAAEISSFLSEPIHIGDAIILQDGTHKEYDHKETADGYTVINVSGMKREYDWEKREYTGRIVTHEHTHKLIPEVGPAREFTMDDLRAGIVVAIHGRNYRVNIATSNDDGIPTGAVVTFTRTDDPETAHTVFDFDAAVAASIKQHKDQIAGEKKWMAEDEDQSEESAAYYARSIEDSELRIADLEGGSTRPWPKGPVSFFGQPQFIQGEIRPLYNGKPAMHLVTLDSSWGDSGNENILFACDDDGVPCAVWFEASCC